MDNFRIISKSLLLLIALTCTQFAYGQERWTFEELAGLAEQRSHQKSQMDSQLELVQIEKQMLKSTYLPKLELAGGYAAFRSDMELQTRSLLTPHLGSVLPALEQLPIPISPDIIPETSKFSMGNNYWGANISANMVLFSGLKVPRYMKALEQKKSVVNAQKEMHSTELLLEFASYYDRALLIRQSEEVLVNAAERLDRQKLTAESAFGNGLIPRHELEKITLAMLKLEAKQEELANSKSILERKLSQLTGVKDLRLDQLEINSAERKVQLDGGFEDRAELKALNSAYEAEQWKYKAIKSNHIPKVAAFSGFRYDQIGNVTIYPSAYVGVGLKWEIFDGLHTNHAIKKAKVEQRMLSERIAETEELLALAEEKSIQDYRQSEVQLKLSRKATEIADKQLEIAKKEFSLGLIKLSELLTAESDYQEAMLEWTQALYNQRQAALKVLEGKGRLSMDQLAIQ
ncbi:outer membrane protein TolC [Algoriphagus sp. 4150]|uniref:TolC family protein n=1 Tax=Algoriphagus sp. 4150 TaxID=2817756 RepID=UPI00285B3C58|nr:TolC family protein [Algoriphagus sp. 4150]MDR7132465.1 outer membrane protein TolC [Algoriphagus sp. 4150]